MKIRLTQDLPIEKKHGAVKGAVFEAIDRVSGRGGLHYFIGKAGEKCGAYRHEYEVVQE